VFPSGHRPRATNKTSKSSIPIPHYWLSINERQGSKANSRGHLSLIGYCSAVSPSFRQQPSNRVASRIIGFALTRQQFLPLSNPCNNSLASSPLHRERGAAGGCLVNLRPFISTDTTRRCLRLLFSPHSPATTADHLPPPAATPEATILNRDIPSPCSFCSHQCCIFNKPSTASFPLATATCNSRTTTPPRTTSGIFNREQLPDRHHRLRLHSAAAPGEFASFPCLLAF